MRTFRPTVPRRSGAYGDKTRNRCEASRSAMVEARNARRLTFMYRVGSCPVLMPRSRGFADLRIAELRSCGVAELQKKMDGITIKSPEEVFSRYVCSSYSRSIYSAKIPVEVAR